MKILMINDSYSGIGGEKTYIKNLIKLLKSAGHDVYFLSISDITVKSWDKNHIITYKFINKFQWFISENIINIKIYFEIKKYLKNINPDIIHFHNIYKLTKTILRVSAKYPTVQTLHDFGIVCPLRTMTIGSEAYKICSGKNKLKCYHKKCLKLQTNLIDYLLFDNLKYQKKIINHFICPSEKLAKTALQYGLNNTTVLPYFHKNQNIIYKNSNNILFVGRLTKEKGVDDLIKSFKIIFNHNNKLTLTIVGSGPESDNLKKLTAEFNLQSNVYFINETNEQEIAEFYKNALVVVIPSIWLENSPLVAYEAMAYAKPIIANNIGGLPELIQDGLTGFLLERFDHIAMANKILKLHGSPDLSRKMGLSGNDLLCKKYLEKYHLDKLISIYHKTINQRQNCISNLLTEIKIGDYHFGHIRETIYNKLNKKYSQNKFPKNIVKIIEHDLLNQKINKISIIVATKNRQSYLEKYAIGSLNKLSPIPIEFEIIVVDNSTNNETENYLKTLNINNLLYLKESKIGCSASRNSGIKKASGDIIIFIDDDCYVDSNWLKRIYEYFKNNNYLIISGYIYDMGFKKILNYTDSANLLEKKFLEGNIAFRKYVFKYVLFNENLIYGAEGYDLISRIKQLIPNFPYLIDQRPITHYRAPSEYRNKNSSTLNNIGKKIEDDSYKLWHINKHVFMRNTNINQPLFKINFWLREISFLPIELLFIFNLKSILKNKLFIYHELYNLKRLATNTPNDK